MGTAPSPRISGQLLVASGEVPDGTVRDGTVCDGTVPPDTTAWFALA
ncbi:MAG: hypothetical protein ACKO48_05685 [Actinomycetota bacterium]